MANFITGSGNKIVVKVSPNPAAAGATQLLGGTQASFSINADVTDSTVFEDALGFSNSVATSQGWEVSWTANLLFSDPGYDTVKTGAMTAVETGPIGITVEAKSESGGAVETQLSGTALVTNYSEDYPADGILTYNCTFQGVGTPVLN